MFLFKQPTRDNLRQFLETQRNLPFSYAEVGASQSVPPRGYIIDHNRVVLGHGQDVFTRAVAVLHRWAMFDIGWVSLCWPDASIEVGTVVGVLARLPGCWSLNACRIVYLVDEDGPVRRYGFAYGTLPEHAERGEERFLIEWNRHDDTVSYDLLAFSQPNQLLVRLGFPVARLLQKRFAQASKQAMLRSVGSKVVRETI
ncbi:MAG: hypothetical protein GFH27_549307n168 [Chloroflexi bacterium AL-W]|nr:hypothetical protein [Chloroflexi bacterium AL-N1]NOK69200.1 hypothetical protein [Chloroflexi bacterium AL-N10]NOK77183.1 hypothetical protein [Chloroflexi bacterium AL-N5]NOK83828.1 hypothetical protein [Chloroflexi bacterium AL-W]NOK91038.1 hypothetical protein [Chloroflexi bacterium AL-N15]